MTRAISDVRVARSFLGSVASTAKTVELDFNLSTKEAIRIYGVLGNIRVNDGVDPILALTGGRIWDQSLHLEEGTVDAPNTSGGTADQFENDSEIIYHQYWAMHLYSIAVAGGGLGVTQSPASLVTFPEPIISVVNPTHRVSPDEEEAGFELLIYYDYIELSDGEMALAFARRRR